MGPPPGAAKPFDPKVAAYVIGGSAVALLIGVFTNSWLSAGRGIGVGPRGVCYEGTCSWSLVNKGDIEAIGYLTLISGIACAALCGYLAFLCFSNTPHRFPKFKLVNGVLGVAAFATTFFFIRLLIESNKEMSISYSPVLAIGGVITAGVFVRKLKDYWPGEGNRPWPVAVAAAPQGGWQQPMGGPPMGGPPMGGPQMGGPPMGAPNQPPPWGAPPMGSPPMGAPMGGAPMGGAPMGGAPMGGAPMGGAPMGGAPMGAPMGGAPMGAPMGGAPMGPPRASPAHGGASNSPYGTASNSPHGSASSGGSSSASPYGASSSGPPAANAFGPPNANKPDQYAATMMSSPGQPTAGAPAPSSNAKTIMGAAAPQLKELLKQPPGGAPQGAPQAGAAPQGGAQAQSKFCGRCGKPMQFVAQYQRWFCQDCQQYA